MTDATVAAGAEAHGGLLEGTLRFGWGADGGNTASPAARECLIELPSDSVAAPTAFGEDGHGDDVLGGGEEGWRLLARGEYEHGGLQEAAPPAGARGCRIEWCLQLCLVGLHDADSPGVAGRGPDRRRTGRLG